MMRYRTRAQHVDAQQFRTIGDGPSIVVAMPESPTGYGYRVRDGFGAVSPGDWVLYHVDSGSRSALTTAQFHAQYESRS